MSMRTPLANGQPRQPTDPEQYTNLGTVPTVGSAFLSPRQRAATPPVSVPPATTVPFGNHTRTGTRSPFIRADPQFPMVMDTVGQLVAARHTMDGDVDMSTPVGSPKSPMTDEMSYINSPENLTRLSQKTLMNRSGGDDDDDGCTETSTQDLSSTSSIGCSVLNMSPNLSQNCSQNLSQNSSQN